MKSLLPVLCLLIGLCCVTVSSVPCAQEAFNLFISCKTSGGFERQDVCKTFDAAAKCVKGTVDKLPADCPASTKAKYIDVIEKLIKRTEDHCSKTRAKRATARVHRHHKHARTYRRTRSHRRARTYRRTRTSFGLYGPSRRYSGGVYRWSPPSGRG